jgi:hypothetical protein
VASLLKTAMEYGAASAERRAELLQKAEEDFQAYLAQMKSFPARIAEINAEIDRKLQES